MRYATSKAYISGTTEWIKTKFLLLKTKQNIVFIYRSRFRELEFEGVYIGTSYIVATDRVVLYIGKLRSHEILNEFTSRFD